uniref:LIM domain 7a n=1 Tax=Nothobranchius furzeri TaxID=105023 RepID=A0A8C6M9V9_NOTFU
MANNQNNISYRRSLVITPKASTQFNQFLPSKDKPSGYVPAPLRKKRAERSEDSRRSLSTLSYAENEGPLTRYTNHLHGGCFCIPALITVDMYDDDSEEDDDEVGYADPVQDDLYARKIGVNPQPVSSVSYNKFLPKFWTPEEDDHIQKIKLGSQRRPWYKKMQGFSPHVQPHTLPQLPKLQSPFLETPAVVFAPVDPSSGPKLVKCEKWPLLGRQDPREPPDPIDYESLHPDLENDDMFARRTLSFQSNTDLAMMKTQLSAKRRLYTSEPQLNIITQQHRHGVSEEIDYPDIEEDDVVCRKEKIQQALEQRAPSGAPDNYTPMHVPEPWALPPALKARLVCPPSPLNQKTATANQSQAKKEACPKTDDMLIRKLGVFSDQSQPSAARMSPSVPSSCSKEDLQKWQAIREASRLRYKKRLMLERLAALKL